MENMIIIYFSLYFLKREIKSLAYYRFLLPIFTLVFVIIIIALLEFFRRTNFAEVQ